jgi:NAD(P)-dependent dehydrogenase (short-subunit alcohol dehydrogenase family)
MPRVAVVTGGASGIGRATVDRLLRAHWTVVLADLNEARGAEMADGREHVSFIVADVSKEEDVANTVEHALETYGRLDCVVNNAGVGGAFGPLTELRVDDWDYTFAVNVRSVFLGTKHAARAFATQGHGGSIINVASIAGAIGGMGPQAYSAAKAAVIHFSRIAAAELAPKRIRVNSVSPGVISTPLVEMGGRDIEMGIEGIQPWPVVGHPDDVARVIEFLAAAPEFMTGADITVDGALGAGGVHLGDNVGGNPAERGLVGVNRGTTGERSIVRERLPRPDRADR